jgi:hypothetical protein
MKQRAALTAVIVCATCTFSIESPAKTPIGSDDFNSNSLSPINWFVPMSDALVAGNGHLQLLTTGPATESKFVQWNRYIDDPTLSWTYRIDVSMPSLGLTATQSVLYGLQLDGADGSHVFSYIAEFVDPDTGSVAREIAASTPSGTPSVTAPNDIATVQLHFDASSQTVFAEYDPDGPDAQGNYSFTTLATQGNFDPTNIFVIGQSSGGVQLNAASSVYGDNVQATTVPEAQHYVFLLSGLAGLGWLGRRRRRGQV